MSMVSDLRIKYVEELCLDGGVIDRLFGLFAIYAKGSGFPRENVSHRDGCIEIKASQVENCPGKKGLVAPMRLGNTHLIRKALTAYHNRIINSPLIKVISTSGGLIREI